jgi:3-hydroxyacyl-[acyl-carrier-protein] dehydratase
VYYLVKVDKARFSRIVVPGDQLQLHVRQKRMLKRMGLYDCRATVDGEEVASAEILCAERSR